MFAENICLGIAGKHVQSKLQQYGYNVFKSNLLQFFGTIIIKQRCIWGRI